MVVINYFVGRQQFMAINIAGEGFLRDLRVRVFDRLQAQSMAFFDRNKAGVLVARMTADIESMGELIQFGLLQFVSAALLLVFTLIVLAVISWELTLVVLMVLPVLVLASIRFQRQSNAAYLDVREKVGHNLSTLQEGIVGVRVIQAYHRGAEQERRFVTSNRALYASHLHTVRISVWYFGLVEFIGVFAIALMVGVGGWLAHNGTVTVGTVAAFVLLLANLFEPVQQLSQLYNTVQAAAASLHKLYGLIDTRPRRRRAPASGCAASDRRPRRARPDVSATTVQNVRRSSTCPSRSRPASGWRWSARRVPARARSPSCSRACTTPRTVVVTFGDVDLRLASMASLRERVVVVPQEGFLFGGTILDNIRVARPERDRRRGGAARSSRSVCSTVSPSSPTAC